MKQTICWIAAVVMLLSSASAVDKKHRYVNNRDSVTYREGTRTRHSNYDPTKLPASSKASDKELMQIERQVSRTPMTKTSKTASPKLAMAPQKEPRGDRNVQMNFQYKAPKNTATTSQPRGKSTGRRLR